MPSFRSLSYDILLYLTIHLSYFDLEQLAQKFNKRITHCCIPLLRAHPYRDFALNDRRMLSFFTSSDLEDYHTEIKIVYDKFKSQFGLYTYSKPSNDIPVKRLDDLEYLLTQDDIEWLKRQCPPPPVNNPVYTVITQRLESFFREDIEDLTCILDPSGLSLPKAFRTCMSQRNLRDISLPYRNDGSYYTLDTRSSLFLTMVITRRCLIDETSQTSSPRRVRGYAYLFQRNHTYFYYLYLHKSQDDYEPHAPPPGICILRSSCDIQDISALNHSIPRPDGYGSVDKIIHLQEGQHISNGMRTLLETERLLGINIDRDLTAFQTHRIELFATSFEKFLVRMYHSRLAQECEEAQELPDVLRRHIIRVYTEEGRRSGFGEPEE